VLGPDGARLAARSERIPAGGPPEAWRVEVAPPAGTELTLRLCARLAPHSEGAQRIGKLRAGWAEPRVERGSDD
jgi:hypothetical protein